ncbi:putative bifunctional diguanylate cyclase/phosphodiesterase [Aquabacterium sp.]|uniref:putative bifunctional diguanylate cyclase/phosphodiesterase n=1 Tax=Aquabacterium sp. TaxID=1872578 RepID=UPI003784DAE4
MTFPDPSTAPRLAAWSQLLAAMADAAWLVDAHGLRVCAVNDAACDLLGRPAEQLCDMAAPRLIATPEDQAFWDQLAQGPVAGHAWLDSETTLVSASGRLVRVQRRIQPLAEAGAAPSHFLVTLQDRTEQQRQQDEREALLAELQATLESTADGILVTDLAGRITAFNRRFAQIWGIPEALLTQRNDEAVYDWMRRSVVDPEAYQRRLAAIQDATLMQANERLTLLSGQVIDRVTQPQNWQGRPTGRVWAFRDQTELEQASQRIAALTVTDGLTGLFNRRQIGEALADSIHQARRSNGTLALLILDLDRFKQINDSLGHEIGDRVLLDTAERLKTCLRQGDQVARIGGDQFALLVQHVDSRGAEAAARRVLEAISRPCAVDGLQFTMTCSVGVALFPVDGDDADQLVRHAETAMQRAKQGGRAGFRFHQPHHDADLRQRMRLDHAMRQALASNRFRLKYQPQLDLASGAVVGAEALIRWRDPELGEVSPAEFIPVAEDSGFIVAVGDWVLAQAVRQAARWRAEGLLMPVSVNVSALQFQQADFIDRVAAVLRDNELPGSLLELELTESILVHDADEALQRLSQLSQLGVRLAIDDFGTGYSSLAYLKRFPIERLKIDRSFIEGVPQDDSDAGIVRAIIQMSTALGMKVIAEGVETEPQRAFLLEAGCDQFQGFLYAPALDALSFDERVRGRPRGGARPQLSLVGR